MRGGKSFVRRYLILTNFATAQPFRKVRRFAHGFAHIQVGVQPQSSAENDVWALGRQRQDNRVLRKRTRLFLVKNFATRLHKNTHAASF